MPAYCVNPYYLVQYEYLRFTASVKRILHNSWCVNRCRTMLSNCAEWQAIPQSLQPIQRLSLSWMVSSICVMACTGHTVAHGESSQWRQRLVRLHRHYAWLVSVEKIVIRKLYALRYKRPYRCCIQCNPSGSPITKRFIHSPPCM